MKDQKTNYGHAFSFYAAIIMGSALLFAGCEPDTENILYENPAEANMQVETKQAATDLPKKELAALRAYIAPYHNFETAREDGYVADITGYRTMMGHHFLKPEFLDYKFNLLQPEVLIYAPGPSGKMRLVGVEYATNIDDMDNPPPAPEGFTGNADEWAINTEFNVWTLHVWVGLNNPNGIFAMHNPRLP